MLSFAPWDVTLMMDRREGSGGKFLNIEREYKNI